MQPTPPGNLKAFAVVILLLVGAASLPTGASSVVAVVSSFANCPAVYDSYEPTHYLSGNHDVPNQWPATDGKDNLSVRPSSNEVAYFDWQGESRDSNGKLVKVEYRITGVTNQVTCAVTKALCGLPHKTDALHEWVNLALVLAAENHLEELPPPPSCHDDAVGAL